MDLELSGKVAFVTGASRGIGAATALLFAREGAHVVVSYNRHKAGASDTAERVRSLGRQAWLCQMDLTREDEVQNALEGLPSAARPLDTIVLCAGDATIDEFDTLTPAQWSRIIDINLNGTFTALQAIRPLLAEQASIVIVASVAAHTGAPHHAHYAAAKAGLVNLTKSAARALAPNVRVNCVAPGMTLTEMGRQTAASLPSDYARKKLLVDRFAEPEEIAKCIAFVASPVASFMRGATVDINGGRDLR